MQTTDDRDERPEWIAEFEKYCERNAIPPEDHPRAMLAFLREYGEAPEIKMERVDE